MNILVIGSGGREHAICETLKKSPQCKELYCAPGNPGIEKVAECIKIKPNDFDEIVEFCRVKHINFVVIGPEAPLVAGISEFLETRGIQVFGPSTYCAQLEGSKSFTKEICKRAGIPTAKAERFINADAAKKYVTDHGAPIVIKADGLAAGKGVVVAMTLDEALAAVDEMLVNHKFGQAGAEILVEEFMEGREASFFAITNGEVVYEFGTACDYKRVGDGNTGPNTGGMGTYSPADNIDAATAKIVMDKIINPTLAYLKKTGNPYKGFLFAGLMLTKDGPKLIEYNCRMGDPETQSILPRLENDFIDVMLGLTPPKFSNKHAVTVVMAAKGYPEDHVKNTVIKGLKDVTSASVFHAGTAKADGKIVSIGGRVLGVTALGNSREEAMKTAYAEVAKVKWPEGFYRKDIGKIYA
jgi:phosphoribosylamine--glycine ligase